VVFKVLLATQLPKELPHDSQACCNAKFSTHYSGQIHPGLKAWWIYVLASTRAPRDIECAGLNALLELSDDVPIGLAYSALAGAA
jgi:hypothetical protein